MKRLAVSLLVLLLALSAAYAQVENKTYGKPLIVLFERSPWSQGRDSTNPTFVLYEKGQVIYKADPRSIEGPAYEIKLSKGEKKVFLEKLNVGDEFYKLPESIDASKWTDQTLNIIVVDTGSRKRVSVYTNLRQAPKNGDIEVPAAFLSVYKQLIGFRVPNAKLLKPVSAEVFFWEIIDGNPKKTVPWPENLPAENPASAGEYKTIVLEAKEVEILERFAGSIEYTTAVEIFGKKMKFGISYRQTFPNLHLMH